MGLLDEAIAASVPYSPRTRLDEIREMMDEDERIELDAALAHPKITHTALAKALTDRGYPINESAVRRHRVRP